MRKIFHFESAREHYQCDAAVVWCYDHRFDLVFRKLLTRIGIQFPDLVRIAGGAKTLASPARESDREFVLEQIRLSMELHGTKKVILMLHSDCGAYGGLKTFESPEKEAENHRQEMHRAARYLKEKFPELSIQAYFVDFGGVWDANLELPSGKIA